MINLATYRYSPKCGDKSAKAIILLFHPLHLHSNVGAHLAKAFADKGFLVLAFD